MPSSSPNRQGQSMTKRSPHSGILARFEELLEAEPPFSVAAIGAALGVS